MIEAVMRRGIRYCHVDPVHTEVAGAAPLIIETNLNAFVTQIGLTDREAMIVAARYGLAQQLTLQEVAEEFDLSRERVRQIEENALRKVRRQLPLVALILDHIEQRAHLLWQPLEDIDARSAIATLGEILTDSGFSDVDPSSTGQFMMYVRFVCARDVITHPSDYSTAITCICAAGQPLRSCRFVDRARQERAEADREWTYCELIDAVMELAPDPLHWEEIARRAEAFGKRAVFSPMTLFNALQNHPEQYARVGQGTYGLVSRGLEEVEGFPDLIAESMRQAGQPLSYEAVATRVLEQRAGKETSIRMLLDLHARFYRSLNGLYGLRSWLPPGDPANIHLPEVFSETQNSWRRVARAEAKGYNVERIIELDRNAS